MCLDDKQSWTGAWMGDHRAGQIDIAATFDLSWTSARVACEWYLVEGARPLYMPEGFDASAFHPAEVPQDIPVSFIGGAYGFRPDVVEFLRQRGIPVRTFGSGWGTRSVWGAEQVEVINRSVINLGMGGIGYSEDLTNVKTRDFEIPEPGARHPDDAGPEFGRIGRARGAEHHPPDVQRVGASCRRRRVDRWHLGGGEGARSTGSPSGGDSEFRAPRPRGVSQPRLVPIKARADRQDARR